VVVVIVVVAFVLGFASVVFDAGLSFDHFGGEKQDLVEPNGVENAEQRQTTDQQVEDPAYVPTDAFFLEDLQAVPVASSDDVERVKEKPRDEPDGAEERHEDRRDKLVFGVSRHLGRLQDPVHGVVRHQNQAADSDGVSEPRGEHEAERDDVMNEHLPKVFSSDVGEL